MKTPIVTIHSGSGASLDAFYKGITSGIDARLHNYRLSEDCEKMSHGLTDAQKGEIETMTAYANHAGDSNGPPPGVHPERWIA